MKVCSRFNAPKPTPNALQSLLELTNDDDDDDEDMRELDATSPVVEGNTESPSTTPPSSAQ